MSARKTFTADEARHVGEEIGIDWASSTFDVEQFRRGMNVELEHGLQDRSTNVTDDDPVTTGKIARAHLNEFSDYYTRLEEMEEQAKREHDHRWASIRWGSSFADVTRRARMRARRSRAGSGARTR